MDIFDLAKLLAMESDDIKLTAWTDSLNGLIHSFSEIHSRIKYLFEHFPADGLYQVLCSYKLLDIYYPPCFLLTNEQNREIFSLLTDSNAQDAITYVEQTIWGVYDNQAIQTILKGWNTKVNEMRYPILEEGIQAYLNGCYYSCNAVLLSQLGGIITDNDVAFSQSDIEDVIKRLDQLKNEQEASGKHPNKEKNILQRHLLINLQGSLCAFAEYCSKYIFSSGNVNQSILDHVANRNKVLHGEMCNFGNRAMALKTIILLDTIIDLPKYQLAISEGKVNA
ncbi:MAG: hypothetical protein E7211_21285 [Clostridium lundense]|nr:hypothetical protein [Clostridium lundense]